MNTSTKKNKIARVATLLLLVLLFAANTLAQTPWQGDGTEQNPYRINNTGDLETLAQQVNSGTTYEGQFFRLNADLTYNTATQNNHTAIGTYTRSFKGTFDGNNHTISGIRISRNSGCQGLFGHCENSTVKNLILTDTQISGNYSIGGIVGYSVYGSSIENCHVANNVTVSGSYEIGGIVGLSFGDCSIADCQVANITINSVDGVGTIVGYYYNTTFHRNYYLGCTVNGVANATDVGTPHGDITENDGAVPGYAIHTAADWDFFCDALQDNATYNHFIGLTVWLTADIEITRMAGSGYHDFMGTFDGQGHTLTVAYGSAGSPITEEYFAPFRNLENGAVIRNLHVGGHIYTSNRFASGIVGCQWGTVSISNCRSSVIIYSSKIGDGTHGGIVADQHGTLTVNGCVFDGLLLTTNGTTLCSGLVGNHSDGTCTISDCLYAPSEADLPWGITYITDGATFCRNYSGTLANCYYTETLGEAQGKLAHSITSEDVTPVFAGEATEYDVSDITTCGTGLQYGSMLYAGNEDQVSLNLVAHNGFSAVAATYTPEGGTATELTPVNGVYTFTMPDADVVIDAVTEYIIHDATEWNNFCDALQDNDTYNRFIGKTVKLAADISVTRMAGSSYHDFMGTFDGQGHTLTIAYGTAESPITEEYAAPFRNLENGAVIRNLHVDGHIYTSDKYASGLAGCQYGTVSISNCRSSVVIHSSKSGDGTHGGIVAVHHGTLTVSGCVYDGRMLTTNGTTLCAGLIGYHYGTITISDCLYAPATDVTPADGETNITSGATFCRNYSGTLDNCYYTETLGTAQGKQAHSITAGEGFLMEMAGEATGYDVSGITSYSVGIMYDSVLYAGNGNQVSLNLTAPEGFYVATATYTPEGGTATELAFADGVYTFTMPDADVVIGAMVEPNAVTQTIALAGTNWFSTNVEITLQDLKDALVASSPSGTQMTVYSQSDGNTTYNGSVWRGQLRALDVTQMYMINVNANCEIAVEGRPIDPVVHPVTLHNGANWLAFPLGESMTLNTAFAGFAVNGDIVISQFGSSTYNGSSWRGSLNLLEPGRGYIYKSSVQGDRTFVFPTGREVQR